MADTFKYVLLSLTRDKGILVWALAFPIVLSCCFMMMFQGLNDVAQETAVRAIVVEDEAYEDATAFPEFIDALSEGDDALLSLTRVATPAEAERLMADEADAEDAYVGYITTDEDGLPVVHLLGGSRSNSANMIEVYQAILVQAMDAFCGKSEMAAEVLAEDPMAFADPSTLEALFQISEVTEKIEVTENAPQESVRYYFALLGMAAMFGAQSSLLAVAALLPNTSALGARRALGGVSRARALAGCMLASWVVSFACLVVAYLFMKFAAGLDLAGRDLPCLAVLAVSSLMATGLGALIGSLPKVPTGAKAGMLTGLVCFAALFAGLYGQPTMELADLVATAAPASQYVNPAVQVSQAMYSLMYYDTLVPCFQHMLVLLAMTAVFFLVSARFLGRQRYASL